MAKPKSAIAERGDDQATRAGSRSRSASPELNQGRRIAGTHSERPEPSTGLKIVQQIQDLVGPAVLLNVRTQTKAPTTKEWQKLTLENMTPEYLGRLDSNIGVSLGSASGGLFTIDCDHDAGFTELLEINPRLRDTLQSRGARGGNFWVRINGSAPGSGRLRSKTGEAIGEWRGDGCQTLLHGLHPSGVRYEHNEKAVIALNFSDLNWPENWVLPWIERTSRVRVPATRPEGGGVRREVVQVMLESIPTRPDRDTWLKISAATRNALGDTEQAIELLKQWSAEEREGEYQELLSSSEFSEIGFGTLVHHAERNGFRGAVRRFFYDGRGYCMQSATRFIPLGSESVVKNHLAELRVPRSSHNSILCSIREQNYVGYMGSLAGHQAGPHQVNGQMILVTSSPRIIAGRSGNGDFIGGVFRDLLYDEQHPEQLERFLNWLAHCRAAVRTGERRQTPALAFAGSAGDGKSLAIEIINRSLGGRSEKAYAYLAGETKFNAELAGAELLVVDDDAASSRHQSRSKLQQSIKANQFSGGVRIEAKGRDAIQLMPVQAIVFAVNNDAEHIRVLPEVDQHMRDKILLLRTNRVSIPEEIRRSRIEISAALDAALPGFLHELDQRDLTSAYDATGRLLCFWHPEIVSALIRLSPEQQLLDLIRQAIPLESMYMVSAQWRGTATELQAILTANRSPTQHAARNLLSWTGSCGAFLGRLSETPDTGVSRGRLNHQRVQEYIITGLLG